MLFLHSLQQNEVCMLLFWERRSTCLETKLRWFYIYQRSLGKLQGFTEEKGKKVCLTQWGVSLKLCIVEHFQFSCKPLSNNPVKHFRPLCIVQSTFQGLVSKLRDPNIIYKLRHLVCQRSWSSFIQRFSSDITFLYLFRTHLTWHYKKKTKWQSQGIFNFIIFYFSMSLKTLI